MKSVVVSRRVLALAGVIGLALTLGAGPVAARPAQPPAVELGSGAGLAPDGRSVTIQLLARCPERSTVVEASVSVSQPQASGRASFPLTCTGAFQSFTVTVQSDAGVFQLGEARAAASVVSRRGRAEEAQDSQVVQLAPTVLVELADTARLEGGGEAVSIDVTTACPVGAAGAQSYVNLSQGQALGNGTYVPTCDGQKHTLTVRVSAAQGLFQVASAQALTFGFVEAGGVSVAGVAERQVQILG